MKKRMISMLLCALMVLSSMGGAVFAAEESIIAEETIVEETIPPVDEFEVVDPHPLEGTVTEEVPDETETPEIAEPLPTEEPTAAETPVEEEAEPESEQAEDSISSGVLDMEEELEPIITSGVNVTPETTFEELVEWAILHSIPASSLPLEMNDYSVMNSISVVQPMSATATSYSSSYRNGPFFSKLDNLTLDEGQLENLLQIAIIHIDYTDGQNADNLSGVNTSGVYNNYSEFGSQYGAVNSAWNALFVNWCARQASIGASIVPVNGFTNPENGTFGTMRTDFDNIQRGDIIYIYQNNNYRVGIVLNVDDSKIYTIEGQRSPNQSVISTYYYRSEDILVGFVSPNYLNSWDYINSGWYFRGANGAMETGWMERYGNWYYLDPNAGGKMVTGTRKINGNWYCFDSSGVMQTGWYDAGDCWYYLDPSSGVMQLGFFTRNGYTYYLSENESTIGQMAVGWQVINGKTYYFRPEENDNGPEGSLVSGWVPYNNKWYYMDPDNACAMSTGWKTISSAGKSGYYDAGDYIYYFNDSGEMTVGWQYVETDWYYLRPADNANGPQGSRATGWIPSGSFWYYADPTNNGAMVTGWKDINGERYYFRTTDPGYGQMVTGTQVIDGITYIFDDDGALVN